MRAKSFIQTQDNTRTRELSSILRNLLVEGTCFMLIIIFIYTGISKLSDFYMTVEQMSESPILRPIATQLAWGIPVIEFVISFLLFFSTTKKIGLTLSLILMSAFTAYILVILNYDEHVPCPCGGIISLLSWKEHLILNSTLILGICFSLISLRRNKNELK